MRPAGGGRPVKVRVLGCSGGIGGAARTTALLIDEDVLIDAGTGVGDLELAALARIDHIFLTHAHLDHIGAVPLLLDSVGAHRQHPVIVHALEATIATLSSHIFNWQVWPDFTQIPDPAQPFLRFAAFAPGAEVAVGARHLRGIPVNHVVPAVGYLVRGARGHLLFSGDTTETDAFWQVANDTADLNHLIIETSFTDAEEALSRVSRHLCPRLLASELLKLRGTPKIYITHLMPGEEQEIMGEIRGRVPGRDIVALERGMVLDV